jgi:NAD(P)-dependent dehydrogenase (short-subunit alcohol dehydrogenase family)
MTTVSFADQVVIVTGAGRGIGRAHALEFARLGAAVVVNDRAAEHGDAVVAEIRSAGGSAVASYDSITASGGGAAIVRGALEVFGTVDAVVNNAGFLRNAYFGDQTPETLAAMLDVHVAGSFFLTQAAWPVFQAKGYGRVVMTSSAGGMFAMSGQANYAAAKAGVYGLAKALAFEGRRHGINVNTVLPHATTDIRRNDGDQTQDPARAAAERAWAEEHSANLKPGLREAMSTGRSPEAISPLVAYLASRDCQLSGEAFAAGCGRYARVFVGETNGWVAPDPRHVGVDDIAANIDAVRATDGYRIPANLYDEIELMATATGIWSPTPA